MIVQLRLDERLIHGQIVTSWVNTIGINSVVVANDEAANDELQKNMLQMATPSTIKVAIKSVEGAIKLLQDPRSEKMGILLICGNPQDVLRLTSELDVNDINIANFRKKKSPDKVTITTDIYADKEDYQAFVEICKLNKNIYSQLLPSTTKYDFREMMAKVK